MPVTRQFAQIAADGSCEPDDTGGRATRELMLLARLRQVYQSRARILAIADGERRRIERDLHDGAQQRLVALRIRLELAAERLDNGDRNTAALLRDLGAEAEAALEDIRSLASGVYPALLGDHGVAAALRSVALHAPIPITILAQAGRRYRREVETAAYFCCAEATQNVTKHAPLASAIHITFTERDTTLVIEVRDDGPGFDPERTRPGIGLTNMRDRLAALGGQLEVQSAEGAGTRILATIPLSGPACTADPTVAAGRNAPCLAVL